MEETLEQISDEEVITAINAHLEYLSGEFRRMSKGIRESLARMDEMDQRYRTGVYSIN